MPKMTLTKESSDNEVENWVGQCIRIVRREGHDAKEAAGKCYGMARHATGKEMKAHMKEKK